MSKETTASRLQFLMSQRRLRQVDILNAALPHAERYGLKLNKSDISQYVSGKVEPSQDKLTVLSEALHVSPAWLLGYDVPMESIGDNIHALRISKKIDAAEISKRLDISLDLFYRYETGAAIPPLHIVNKLSSIFEVDIFEIIGWNDFPIETRKSSATQITGLADPKEDLLISNYRSLDPEKKNSLIDYSDYLKNQM